MWCDNLWSIWPCKKVAGETNIHAESPSSQLQYSHLLRVPSNFRSQHYVWFNTSCCRAHLDFLLSGRLQNCVHFFWSWAPVSVVVEAAVVVVVVVVVVEVVVPWPNTVMSSKQTLSRFKIPPPSMTLLSSTCITRCDMYKWYNYITLVYCVCTIPSFIIMSHGTVRIFVQYTYIHMLMYIRYKLAKTYCNCLLDFCIL